MLQWLGLGGHGYAVYKFDISYMEDYAHAAELDDKDERMGPTQLVQYQTSYVLDMLIQVVPMAFLFYLTRSREAGDCFRMIERVPLKWWLVAVPLIGPLGMAITNAATYGPLWFFFDFAAQIPFSLALLLCLAYAVDFGAPSVESLEALKPKVTDFQAINEPRILMMNLGLIGPMVLVKGCQAVNDVWRVASFIVGEDLDDDDVAKKELIIGFSLCACFHVAAMFCLLAPAAYHTATMTDFVKEMSSRYCDAGGFGAPCPGSLRWVEKQFLGWAVLGVKITPALLAKMGTTVFTAAYLFYSNAVTS